jgi:hypothetical protein
VNFKDSRQNSEEIYWDTYYKMRDTASLGFWKKVDRVGAGLSAVIFDQINHISANIAEEELNEGTN